MTTIEGRLRTLVIDRDGHRAQGAERGTERVRRASGTRRRSAGEGRPVVVLALFVPFVAALLSLPPSDAAFSVTTAGTGDVTAATLAAPTAPSCAWTGANSLQLSWTNPNGTIVTGHTQQRSNSSGSGFAALGTTSPGTVLVATDANPAPPTLRYYRVLATTGSWTSPASSEVVSNTCRGTIVAFAGGGASTSCTYSGPASGLQLSLGGIGSAALAVDTSDNLLVFDNTCVRRISPGGTVSWVAGGGGTSSCTTTTAANVALNGPGGVAVDSSNNIYLADFGNDCVRRIDTLGNVTRVAGGGGTSSCTTTTASNVSLSNPLGIRVDSSGIVYVADLARNCVRRINGTTVTAVAGNGTGGANWPANGATATATAIGRPGGLAIDASGRLVVADFDYACVYRVDFGTGQITRLTGASGTQGSCSYSGTATSVAYNSATVGSVAVSPSGDVFFNVTSDGDPMNRACIVKISGTTASQVAGRNGTGSSGNNGPAIAAFLTNPRGMAFNAAGDLYIADAGAERIRRVINP